MRREDIGTATLNFSVEFPNKFAGILCIIYHYHYLSRKSTTGKKHAATRRDRAEIRLALLFTVGHDMLMMFTSAA